MATEEQKVALDAAFTANTRFTQSEREDLMHFLWEALATCRKKQLEESYGSIGIAGCEGFTGKIMHFPDVGAGPLFSPENLTKEGFEAFTAAMRELPKIVHLEPTKMGGPRVQGVLFGPIVAKWRLKLGK